MAISLPFKSWRKDSSFGVTWLDVTYNDQKDSSSNCGQTASNDRSSVIYKSPTFSSSSGKKWQARLIRLLMPSNFSSSGYQYYLQIVAANGVSFVNNSVHNNCYSFSVNFPYILSLKSSAVVVFNLKVEMATPMIYINSEQLLKSLEIKVCHRSEGSKIEMGDRQRNVPVSESGCFSATKKMLCYFSNLMGTNDFCDVIIQVQGISFPAHRCVLAAHSEVFEVMLKTDMKENRSGIIEIKDLKPETIKEMLKFMYTQQHPSFSDELAVEVYKVSHMYGINELLDYSFAYLLSNMQDSNVLDCLSLGADYSHDTLIDTAMRYLVVHSEITLDSKKCMSIIQKHPSLFELLLTYSKKSNQ